MKRLGPPRFAERASFRAARLIGYMLYGVDFRDPLTFTSIAAGLLLVPPSPAICPHAERPAPSRSSP